MLARKRNQLIRGPLCLGRPARRGRRQALIDKGVGGSVTMNGLSGKPDTSLNGHSRLVRVAAVPERPSPDALGGNPDVRTKPERKLPVLLGPVQFNRTIEVGQR